MAVGSGRQVRLSVVAAAAVVLGLLGAPRPAFAAPDPAGAGGPAHAAGSSALTAGQAAAAARASGRPVAVGAATTPTDTLVANPDGSLALTRHAVPVHDPRCSTRARDASGASAQFPFHPDPLVCRRRIVI